MSKEPKVIEVAIPIGIQPGTKLLQLRWMPEAKCWKLWLHHDKLMQHGTFLTLEPDGGVLNTTLRVDGTEDTFRVK